MLCDPSLEAYRAAKLRRGVLPTLSLGGFKNFLGARKKGFHQGRTQGDPWQQGGSLVVQPGGQVLFRYISKVPGDHAPPATLLQQLP